MRWINLGTGIAISIEEVPGRKSQGLFVVTDGVGVKVGNVTDPEKFIEGMNGMLQGFTEE